MAGASNVICHCVYTYMNLRLFKGSDSFIMLSAGRNGIYELLWTCTWYGISGT